MDDLLTVGAVSLLAAISPGPDFFIVLKNSLIYSRKTGLATAVGISLALLIHLTYTIVGIGALMTEGSFFFYVLKYLGASYLFYIGVKGFLASFENQPALNTSYAQSSCVISTATALKQGFLTNLLNPKCALFFISFFSQFIIAETPTLLKIGYGLVNWSVTLGWFLLLSYMISTQSIMMKMNAYRRYVERLMGSLLMLLGLKLFI